MSLEQNNLSDLVCRAKAGDGAAGQALHQAVDPHMRLLVREALRSKQGPFAQQVSEVMYQIGANCSWANSLEQFIDLVARRMSANFKERCMAGKPCNHWSKDTVPNECTA